MLPCCLRGKRLSPGAERHWVTVLVSAAVRLSGSTCCLIRTSRKRSRRSWVTGQGSRRGPQDSSELPRIRPGVITPLKIRTEIYRGPDQGGKMLLEDVLMIFFNQCQVQFVSVWGGGMEPRGGGAHPYAIIMSRQIDPVQPAFVCYGRACESTVCHLLYLDRCGE